MLAILALGVIAPPAFFPLAAEGGVGGAFAYAVLMGVCMVSRMDAIDGSERMRRARIGQRGVRLATLLQLFVGGRVSCVVV